MIRTTLTIAGMFMGITLLAQVESTAHQAKHTTFPFLINQKVTYYDTLKDSRGSGKNQLMRELHYWSRRLDAEGNLPEPGKTTREVEHYLQTHAPTKNYGTHSGNWTELGPFLPPSNSTTMPNGAGRINCLTFHPQNPNIIYAGAPSGGFWKTEDGGLQWERHIDGLMRMGISSIVVHPENTDILYIGTGDRDANTGNNGQGVWRSTDGGLNWHPWNTGMGYVTVNEILMHPDNPSILLAATNDNIYRSTDGGANWTATLTGRNCKDIAFHPTNPSIVYAVEDAFYKSDDNGQSFQRITIPGVPTHPTLSRMALAVSAAQPDWVYVIAGGKNGHGLIGVYRSTNRGASFVQQSNSPNILGMDAAGQDNKSQSWYDLVLYANPNNANTIYVGAINLWRSLDGGVNWELVTHRSGDGGVPAVHADVHAIEQNPYTQDMYMATDGGVHYTTDNGQSWMDISDGLSIAQIYRLGVSAGKEPNVIIGKQDNGTAIFYEQQKWATQMPGDGMECFFDPLNDKYVYASRPNGYLMRSTDGGDTFEPIAGERINRITEAGDWVTPFELHPENTNIMYAGYKNVWITKNVKVPSGSQIIWEQISDWATDQYVWALAVAPSNANVVYVSHGGSEKLYKTTTALSENPTWESLTNSLPNYLSIQDIEVDPNNPNHLWIALGNKIYESADGGHTWTDISGTLPDINLNTIVLDQESPLTAVYIGMDVGVYYRDNTMEDWLLFSTNLPNVEIFELEIYQSSTTCESKLYAATYGSGLWASDLHNPGNFLPKACFETNVKNSCIGQVVQFKDMSSYEPNGWHWSITPASFTYVNGTSEYSQHPEVIFQEETSYAVSLTVTNTIGNNTVSKPQALTVKGQFAPTAFSLNFDNLPNCGTATDCDKTICAVSDFWKNSINGVEDDIDWRVHEGATPSSATGPLGDFNSTDATGQYIYLESSGDCYGNEAVLESTCMELDGAYELYLAYHMYGEDMGSLHIDMDTGEGWQEDVIPPLVGNQSEDWETLQLDLSPYTGTVVRIRLRGKTGKGYNSDLALDDIRLVPIQGSALATIITDLDGSYKEGVGNLIHWRTDGNEIGERFNLQRFDVVTKSWQPLQTNPVTTEKAYTLVDLHPMEGSNLYRILVQKEDEVLYESQKLEIETRVSFQIQEVFPNPVREELSLPVVATNKMSLLVSVTDLLGKNIYQKRLDVEPGQQTFTIPAIRWEKGMYIVQVGDKEFKVTKF